MFRDGHPSFSEITEHNDIVRKILSPFEIEDSIGRKRKIFHLGGKEIVFCGREEKVEIDAWEEVKRIGEQPRITSSVESAENTDKYCVVKSVFGVLTLIETLGNAPQEMVELRRKFETQEFDEQTYQFLDELVAANYISDDLHSWNEVPQESAEALVLLAYSGNEQAKKQVDEKLAAMRRLDEQYSDAVKERVQEEARERGQALDPKDLVCVHATRFEPQKDETGNIIVASSFDATNGEKMRNSVHVALNHKVSAHGSGSWQDAGYIIIAPLVDMVRENGAPNMVNTVDTWWALNPGQELQFTDASVVMPVSEQKEVVMVENNEYRFKKSPYLGSDISEIKTVVGEESFNSAFLFFDDSSAFLPFFKKEVPKEWFGLIEELRDLYRQQHNVKDLLSQWSAEEKTIEACVRAYFSRFIPDGFPEELLSFVLVKITKKIEDTFSGLLSEHLTKQAIADRGFRLRRGGGWGWGGEDEYAAQGAAGLAATLGCEWGPHSASANSNYEYVVGNSQGRAADDPNYTYRVVISGETVQKLDIQTRRVMYLGGYLTN